MRPNPGRSIPGRLAALVIFVLSLTAGLTLVAQTPPRELHLVSTAWSPFTNAPGQPRFALDLVEAAFAKINVKATTTIVDAPAYTSSLLSAKFDGSAAAWKDAEREKYLLFSQPYLENRLILVGRHGADVSATTLAALNGKRIAIVGGYAYGDAVNAAGPAFVRTASDEDGLTRLLANSVDYVLMDDLVVRYILGNYAAEAKARLAVGSTPVLVRPLYFAVRRDLPDAESLVTRFNGTLRTLITDGSYNRLLHVDWVEADVDDDGQTELIAGSDRPGPVSVATTYPIFSTPPIAHPLNARPGQKILIGGSVYDGWTSVPDRYKVEDRDRPDPNKSTLGIFRFVW